MVRALLAGSASQEVGGVDPDAIAAAGALLADGPVTVVLGRANLAESADGVVAAAAAIHAAHPDVRFLSALRRGNVHGALDMGLAPGLLPGRHRSTTAGDVVQAARLADGARPSAGLDATGILQAAAGGKVDVLVLLGADPLADFPDTDLAARAVAGARTVIAVDRFLTASAQQADVVLAASGPAETDGTTTNLEGRISTVARKITPPGTARDDWMLAAELARLLGTDLGVESAGQILDEITAVAPSHARPHRRRDPRRSRRRRRRRRPPPRSAALPTRRRLRRRRPSRPARRPSPPRPPTPRASSRPPRPRPPRRRPTPRPTAPSRPSRRRRRRPRARRLWRSLRRRSATRRRSTPTRCAWSRPGGSTTSAPMPSTRPGSAALTSDTVLRLHPHDFDRLGVAAGDVVTATSSKGSVSLPVQPDDRVGRGAAVGHPPPAGRHRRAPSSTPPHRVTEIRVVKP